ncbi:hypothetical protein HNP40_004089 [Mycobacteroides chelonae]|nr:hypothetical protein [Mycobacteroides chelonae]
MTGWIGLTVAATTLITGVIAASTAITPNVACACSCVDVRKDATSLPIFGSRPMPASCAEPPTEPPT